MHTASLSPRVISRDILSKKIGFRQRFYVLTLYGDLKTKNYNREIQRPTQECNATSSDY